MCTVSHAELGHKIYLYTLSIIVLYDIVVYNVLLGSGFCNQETRHR